MSPIPLFRAFAILAAVLGFLSGRLSAQIGGLDPSFAPGAILNGASPGTVRAVYSQTNGQVIIAGEFTSIGGTARGRIARLNADGTLDATFAPNAGADGTIHTLSVQSDGTIYIGGEFANVDGTARNRIARLTSTGVLDTNFNPGTGCNGTVYATLLSGTTVFIGGDFTTVNGITRNRVAKLAGSGALDTFFVMSSSTNASVYCLASDVTTSSYLFAGGAFTAFNGSTRSRLARVSVSSGSVDSLFNATGGPNNTVYSMACVSDGIGFAGLYVGGDFTTVNSISRSHIARYSTSGSTWTLDAAFNFYLDNTCRVLRLTGSSFNNTLRLYTGGDFTSQSGQSRGRVARWKYVTGSGSSSSYWDIDATYSTAGGANGTIYGLQLTSDGKTYLGGAFTTVDGTATQTAARLYGDLGSQPPATPTGLAATSLSSSQVQVLWNSTTGASSYSLERSPDGSTGWTVLSSAGATFYDTGLSPGSTVYYRVKAVNSNGSSAYSAGVSATALLTTWTGSGSLAASPGAAMTNGTVSDILVQADGKILIAGSFSTVLGQPRANVARLLPDYTLDPTFNPGTGPNSSVTKMALMPDGRIYLLGGFSSVSGVTRNYLARLNPSGSLDTSFDSGSGSVFIDSIAMQDDGRLLVCGKFSGSGGGFSGSGKGYLIFLNLDGSVDNSFDPQPNSWVEAVSVQPDGRIIIGGIFSTIHGVSRPYLARLNADGTLDTNFTPTGYSGQSVKALKDGNILLFDSFSSINGVARQYLAILNGDGTLNTTFVTAPGTAPNVAPSGVFPQPDGKFIITGSFTKVGSTTAWKIARLNADGSLDTTFNVEAGPLGGSISVATPLRDSSILVGGSFSQFGTATQNNLAGLNGDGVLTAPAALASVTATTVSSGSITIAWSSVPGGFSYKIERSLDGVSGWLQVAELPWSFSSYTNSGLTAGTTFHYRVRASNYAGDSAYAATVPTPTYTGYQQWKINSGFSVTEPDSSDSDGDGIPLILEYALGTNPRALDQDVLPIGQTLNGTVAMSYRRFRSDVI